AREPRSRRRLATVRRPVVSRAARARRGKRRKVGTVKAGASASSTAEASGGRIMMGPSLGESQEAAFNFHAITRVAPQTGISRAKEPRKNNLSKSYLLGRMV